MTTKQATGRSPDAPPPGAGSSARDMEPVLQAIMEASERLFAAPAVAGDAMCREILESMVAAVDMEALHSHVERLEARVGALLGESGRPPSARKPSRMVLKL